MDLFSNGSVKDQARLTGFLYGIIILSAGFSQGYVRESLIVANDAAATAANILAEEELFRWGMVTDLIAFICDLAVAILLYILLKPVNNVLAMVSAGFRLLAHPAIGSLNLLNHYMVLELLGDAEYLQVFDSAQLEAGVLVLMNAHKYGYLIAGAFFGVHLCLLGYLLYQSRLFPKWTGVLICLASVGYLLESFGDFLYPGNEVLFSYVVGLTAVLGEVSLALWMIVKGANISE